MGVTESTTNVTAGCCGTNPTAETPEPESTAATEGTATEACCGAAPTAETPETPKPAQLFGRCC